MLDNHIAHADCTEECYLRRCHGVLKIVYAWCVHGACTLCVHSVSTLCVQCLCLVCAQCLYLMCAQCLCLVCAQC